MQTFPNAINPGSWQNSNYGHLALFDQFTDLINTYVKISDVYHFLWNHVIGIINISSHKYVFQTCYSKQPFSWYSIAV